MKLYFDIGNTNIKLNFQINSKEFYVSYNTKENYSVDSFYNLLPDAVKGANISKVMITSVVPRQEVLIEGLSKKYFQIVPIKLEFPLKTGIKINATNPKRVGADLVALAAFVAKYSSNGIMVNLGTSTTLTHVQNKIIKGVIIAPGLMTSFNSLVKNAAALPEVTLKLPNKSLGNNTEESISIGVLRGQINMIKGFLKDIDPSAKVFISGGNSRLIKDFVEWTFIKEATLEGLKIIEVINEN